MKLTIAKIGDNKTVSFAVEELVRLIKEMDSTLVLDVRKYDAFDKTVKNALWVGLGFTEKSDKDTVCIDVKEGVGFISASNERTVLIAVYRFMKELGCRFIRPGKDGEKIPEKKLSASLLNVKLKETASYNHRGVCIEGSAGSEHIYNMVDWLPKVGMNAYFKQFFTPATFFKRYYGDDMTAGDVNAIMDAVEEEIEKRGCKYHTVGHGWTCEPFGIEATGWDKFPEAPEAIKPYLALVGGKRDFRYGIALNTNLCYSNPEVQEKMVNCIVDYCKKHPLEDYVHFWLADGRNNHCECENCQKHTPSDFYVILLNKLDKQLTKENINTKIVCLLYNELMFAPETEKLSNPDRFTLMFAPITRTYSTSYDEVDLDEKIELEPYVRNNISRPASVAVSVERLRMWQREQGFKDSFLFDYHLMWDHHYDPGYYEVAEILQRDMASLDKLGLDGMVSCQLQRTALPTALPLYAMAEALWDKNKSFKEISKEYFAAAFGEDADTVEGYMAELSRLFEPKVLRGSKPFEKEAMAQQYEKAKETVEDFKKNCIEKKKEISKDWEYLYYHAEMVKLYADAYILYFRGKDEESKAAIEALKQYVDETKAYTDSVLDDFFLKGDIYNNIFGWRKTI